MTVQAAVVLLAGGFGQTLVHDILNPDPSYGSREAATVSNLRKTIVQGRSGEERICPALIPLKGQPAIQYTLKAVEGIQRAKPLGDNVYIVVNEVDRPQFVQPGGVLDGVADLGLRPDHVISNGARSPSQWRGEVADLQLAIQHIQSASSSGSGSGSQQAPPTLLAVSCSVVLLPGFNLQRVLEHAIVRDRDVVGVTELTDVECALSGTSAYTLAYPSQAIPVSPLASLMPGSHAAPGVEVARPIAVLKPSSLPKVLAAPLPLPESEGTLEGGGGDIAGLMAYLFNQQGVAMCGTDLGYGVLPLAASIGTLDYAEHFWTYFFAHVKPNKPTPGQLEELMASERLSEEQALKLTGTMGRQYGAPLHDSGVMNTLRNDFNKCYFTGGEPTSCGCNRDTKQYFLPPTFYMTAYRRLGADIMR